MTEATITLVNAKTLLPLFGTRDQHIKRIRDAFGVDITHRDGQIRVAGSTEAVATASEVLKQMKSMVEQQGTLDDDEVSRLLRQQTGEEEPVGHGPTVEAVELRRTKPPPASPFGGFIVELRFELGKESTA